jgi:MYXO-CTERM domain-containing protein
MRAAIATSAHTWETSYRAGSIDAGAVVDVDASPAPAASPSPRGNACGCATAGATSRSRDALFAVALLALALAGRRSHRGSRETQRRAEPDHRPIENVPPCATGGARTIRRMTLKS